MKLITEYTHIKPYTEILNYHCVWFGNLLDHHILCLASLFNTQLNPSVILWTDQASYINLAKLDQIFKNYRFRVHVGYFEESDSYDSLAFRSDKWRLQILKQYGGIYFDLDILFLKDISWFANYGRAIVQEGYTTEKVFNNAIMYFPLNHSGLNYWLSRIGNKKMGWHTVFDIQKYSDEFDADMIPNSVTDRGWTNLGPRCDDFFEKCGLIPECLSDSLLYHWHNRWNKTLHKDGTLVACFWEMYVKKNPNIRF